MIYYYKILDFNNQLIGYANSYDLRYYNETIDSILNCREGLGQYIYYKDNFYRINWLHREAPQMKGRYPEARMFIVDRDEYMEWFEKQNSEEK